MDSDVGIILLFIQSILRKLGREDRGPESIRQECVTSNFAGNSFETLSYVTGWNFLITYLPHGAGSFLSS